MRKSIKQVILNYMARHYPYCSVANIADAVGLTSSTCAYFLESLSEERRVRHIGIWDEDMLKTIYFWELI